MLDFMQFHTNAWEPPNLEEVSIIDTCVDGLPDNIGPDGDYLIITQVEPYIDSLYVHFTGADTK